MKLINSLTEANLRKELLQSKQGLLESEEGTRIIKTLESVIGEVKVAYILSWIPDQCEDFYFILVNGKIVVEIEVENQSDDKKANTGSIDIIKCQEVEGYQKHLQGTHSKLRLIIALELSKNDLAIS